MPKHKQYINMNVLDAAKQRINEIIDRYDNVIVGFSGGKDSTVLLYLLEECYRERGIKDKVKVRFIDEEIVDDAVVQYVQKLHDQGRFDVSWYCVPLMQHKFIFGRAESCIMWDINRPWIRQPPEYAIFPKDFETNHYTFKQAEEFSVQKYNGTVAILHGVRSDESYRVTCNVLSCIGPSWHQSNITNRIAICRPIYDWKEKDVFLYFYQRSIEYCKVYDTMLWNKEILRDGVSISSEASKHLDQLKDRSPKYYQQVMSLFPELLSQSRYFKSVDLMKEFDNYPHTIDGVEQFVKDIIKDPHSQSLAMESVKNAKRKRQKENPTKENCYCGYPIRHLVLNILAGIYIKQQIPPISTLTQYDVEFEEINRTRHEGN